MSAIPPFTVGCLGFNGILSKQIVANMPEPPCREFPKWFPKKVWRKLVKSHHNVYLWV